MPNEDCCLCSQIEGREDNDLIARLLPGEPYVRRIMIESPSFAVLPSLGPLAPGHSLLCPKAHLASFARVGPNAWDEYRAVKAELKAKLSALYRAEVAVFEHGMDDTRDRVLCSVDHAHIHFVPLPRTFDAGNTARDPEWIEFDGQLATLDRLSDGGEYVFYEAPDGVCRLLASRHRKLESQYMRRIIAEGLGRAQHWNWREAPDARTADQTWRRFRGRQ